VTVEELSRILHAAGLVDDVVVELIAPFAKSKIISDDDAARILKEGLLAVQVGAEWSTNRRRGSAMQRYVDLGVIGHGDMGEVRRVLDRDLGRTFAMKIFSPQISQNPESRARLIEEARVTARLQHPGILPLYDLGKLADGRLFYLMREVRGRSLGVVIREVHQSAREEGKWIATSSGWTFRRLVDAFLRVCEAVAYAHTWGVVHCDLKPRKVLVGVHGEVLVIDWGLAKVVGGDLTAEAGELHYLYDRLAVSTDRSKDSSPEPRVKYVTGTPAYMAPEQVLAQFDRIDARSDVYALGAILYVLLTGRSPYTGQHGSDVVRAVLAGPPPPIDERADIAVPEDLQIACEKAMARAQKDRFQSASQLARAIEAWLRSTWRSDAAGS
jgi:serine/threonine-protein kinase